MGLGLTLEFSAGVVKCLEVDSPRIFTN